MRKTTANVALDAGATVLLVFFVDILFSVSAGLAVKAVTEVGMALAAVLMGWGTYGLYVMQKGPETQAREAVERIRSARHG